MNRAITLLALGFLSARVLAHSVWIEPLPSGDLAIRFAEPDGKLERSPGHLDELQVPTAWKRIGTNSTPVTVEKSTDHFRIGPASPRESVQIETAYPVRVTPGRPGRRPFFYARWHADPSSPALPALTLDLVPTGKQGEVRALFRGKPLAGVKATLRTPDEKERELTADNEGLLRFESNQSGLHLLTIARHRESLPGFAGGLAYDLTSHNAALTWMSP